MKKIVHAIQHFVYVVLRALFASLFKAQEKYHHGIYQGYDGRIVQFILKTTKSLGLYRDYYKFYYKSPFFKNVPFKKPIYDTYLKELKEVGFTKIDEEFTELADYINDFYIKNAEAMVQNGQIIKEHRFDDHRFLVGRYVRSQVDKTEKDIENGVIINLQMSFSDPKLGQFLLEHDLNALLYNYYGRQHYFRNQPILMKTDWKKDRPHSYNGNYHFDHLRQISIMFLLNDLGMEDTHMEFALKSHKLLKTVVTKNGSYFSREYVLNHYDITHAIGKKGTIFIFDTAGLHSAHYKESQNPRKIVHLNVNTGHNLEKCDFNKKDSWQEYKKSEPFIKHAFDKVLI